MELSALAFAHEAVAILKPVVHAITSLGDFSVAGPQPAPIGPAPSAAPLSPIDVTTTTGPEGSHPAMNLSPIVLFMQADIVVKVVMGILLLASFWSWAIIIEKTGRLGRVKRQAERFEQLFWSGKSLDDLHAGLGSRGDNHPMAQVFTTAMREWRRSFEGGTVNAGLLPGVKDRIAKVMNVSIGREISRLERQLGFLATVGSNAPFIGLFGTVWGIMNSFSSIAASHDTSLAVVAPGIAEALFATAMGLLAAIPASVAYNHLADGVGRFAARLEGFSDEFAAILSRQLDERAR
jgi:biopolymer transport protein TolQ